MSDEDAGLPLRFTRCRCCGQAFSVFNVFTDAGWLEARLSGLCEVCYEVIEGLPRRPLPRDEDEGPAGT
jgi:hypothetical protein